MRRDLTADSVGLGYPVGDGKGLEVLLGWPSLTTTAVPADYLHGFTLKFVQFVYAHWLLLNIFLVLRGFSLFRSQGVSFLESRWFDTELFSNRLCISHGIDLLYSDLWDRRRLEWFLQALSIV